MVGWAVFRDSTTTAKARVFRERVDEYGTSRCHHRHEAGPSLKDCRWIPEAGVASLILGSANFSTRDSFRTTTRGGERERLRPRAASRASCKASGCKEASGGPACDPKGDRLGHCGADASATLEADARTPAGAREERRREGGGGAERTTLPREATRGQNRQRSEQRTRIAALRRVRATRGRLEDPLQRGK